MHIQVGEQYDQTNYTKDASKSMHEGVAWFLTIHKIKLIIRKTHKFKPKRD